MNQVKNSLIEKIRNIAIGSRYQRAIQRLALFGSTARGDANANSDVDLLLDIDSREVFTLIDLMRFKHELEDGIGKKVDLVPRRSVRPRLMSEIFNSAVTIYEK